MQVQLERIDDAFHFVGSNEAGNRVHLDLTEAEGGTGQGIGATQLLAMSLGSCSSIDIVLILQRGRQPVDGFRVTIEYEREKDQTPALFTRMDVHYALEGELDADKVHRAVALSLEKYCSVARIVGKTIPIDYSFSVNGERFEGGRVDFRSA